MPNHELLIIIKVMNKIFSLASAVLVGCTFLSSCMAPGTSVSPTPVGKNSSAGSTGAALASALVSQSGNSTANTILSAVNNGSLISGVLGLLTGGTSATTASITGTWSYVEPTVQFESQNLLAQAGGVLAAQKIVEKVSPYYQKVGITPGAMKITFNKDNTCVIVLGSRTINGSYTFNTANNTITLKDQLGLLNLSGFATVSANQLALTFDNSKLLTMATAMGTGNNAGNNVLSSISQLAGSYSGMKTGFMFSR